ncbi:MAG TPA: AbrB family transcriptional regulator [Bosea sp. (in: a-proteobacteria)]|jgi:putative addiction module antidote|uniref:AbrB family transcriptional regulator n=1 Tax=Bosea sp. (in: a-proteobacteria) TaxID=1871050 RepID=UPI002DDCCE85|nr:AbrB family transcriptional regulator [Bosea sp. (in: a-proteobacteria)]HEV2552408.1 AbrB family transcriptional regulator [Bosea sp. (in: a-proteobacteria)]
MNETVPPQAGEAVPDVVQLRKIGNSVGIILTKDILARFRLAEGDRFTVVQQPGGEVKLVPYDDVHARGMEIARRSFKKYAATYRELAK